VSHLDNRYFGLMELAYGWDGQAVNDRGYSLLLGLRNSHDKSFQSSIAIGERVFVCDNLAFHGKYVATRRHTTHILRDFPKMVDDGMQFIVETANVLAARNEDYKIKEASLDQAESAAWRLLGEKAFALKDRGFVEEKLCQDFLEKDHPTVWDVKQVFTDLFKRYPSHTLTKRSMALHSVLDQVAGFYPEIHRAKEVAGVS
jgi:hypothetical protein